MAIERPIQELSLRIKEEITSKDTRLMRFVQRNSETGFLEALFPISVAAESITYVLDADGNKIDIYEQRDLGVYSISPPEVLVLWSEQVTLADGTVTYLGTLLADRIDQMIQAQLGA